MRLELTRRTDYAMRAMLALARQPNETLSSTDLAAATGIPVRFATQVMAHLVRAELARGVIGRTGGYRLAKPPEDISVLSIVEAVEAETPRQICALRGSPCGEQTPCEIHFVLADARAAFLLRLGDSSLAEVAAGPPVEGRPPI